MLSWVQQRYGRCTGPLHAKAVRRDLKEEFGADVSLATVRKILRLELSMSYRKVYRQDVRANTVQVSRSRSSSP